MPIFRFESRKEKRVRRLSELADDIATASARKCNYDRSKDPVLAKFIRNISSSGRNTKKRR